MDNNPCSATFGQTRTGTFVEANSPYCGYTPPPTQTPTPTPTSVPTNVIVSVINGSLDLPITGVEVDGINVSYVSGIDLPLSASDNGIFQTTLTGTRTLRVYYNGVHTPSQHIIVQDSDLVSTCHVTNGSAGYFDVTVAINSSNDVIIQAYDGVCP